MAADVELLTDTEGVKTSQEGRKVSGNSLVATHRINPPVFISS